MLDEYDAIELKCKNEFKNDFPDRKSTALYLNSCTYPAILFSMLDGKDYSQQIWKMIKPKFEKPFKESE